MGDNFSAPKIEKRNNAVEEQTSEQATPKQSTERAINTPSDIYMNSIDKFVKLLKGEVGAGSLDERRKAQKDFIDSVGSMLELDYDQFKSTMDYFLITVSKEPIAFAWDSVLSPLSTLEGRIGSGDIERYKKFIMFVILLSENARNRTTFTQMFDMTKFEALFPQTSRENLHNYVYR